MNVIIKKLSGALCAVSLLCSPVLADEDYVNPYPDLAEEHWCYEYVTGLNRDGIIPEQDAFEADEAAWRGTAAMYLYNLNLSRGGESVETDTDVFFDLLPDTAFGEGATWAYENSIVEKMSPNEWGAFSHITREELCAAVINYLNYANASVAAVSDETLFADAVQIGANYKSAVMACKIAGIVSGGDDVSFRPKDYATNAECAAVIYNLKKALERGVLEGETSVLTGEGDYLYLYKTEPHAVEASEAVDDSWFNDAVFIGDSVTEGLKLYRGDALAGAKFLSATSMSATTILSGKIKPTYQGEKVTIEEGVKLSGAKYVYIMMGMNNIPYGTERATGDMVTVINSIIASNPDVKIFIESVTPMTSTSSRKDSGLNNQTIAAYNERMMELAAENGWYYINVAEAVSDENGYLISSYCSDANNMGLHFNSKGVAAWVNYLKTHVPAELK
ncbi:MAG: GDSL-type esterase/lipase family protein [Clostridia bacterium]|nr:GDSL-type esterase/lipase family protein [Clostridia bacterium]